MAKNETSFAQGFFATGVEAYVQQCRHGGVKLHKAAALTDRDVYAFPPTPRDQEGYGKFESSADFNARVIVARLRTSDNRTIFTRPNEKADAIKLLMGNRVSSIAVGELAEEILQAYGEAGDGEKTAGDNEADSDEEGMDVDTADAAPAAHHTPNTEAALGN